VTWIAVAVGGSAIIGAGASYYGSKKQSDAAKDAAGLSMDQFRLLNQQQQPFMQGGYGAMGKLNTLLGLNPRPAPAATPDAPTPLTTRDLLERMAGGPESPSPTSKMILQLLARQQGGVPAGAGSGSTTGRMLQQLIARQGASSVPEPRPDAQPIKYGSTGTSLNQLLALRASHGDRQANFALRGMF
jgi:hypothetical protein